MVSQFKSLVDLELARTKMAESGIETDAKMDGHTDPLQETLNGVLLFQKRLILP